MRWLVCALALGSATSCVTRCVPGEMQSCVCTNQSHGAQQCSVAGVFAACRCVDAGVAFDAGVMRFDAGVEPDAGVVCSPFRYGPYFTFPYATRVWRVPTGGEIDVTKQVDPGSEGDGFWLSYRVADGGVQAELPGDGGAAQLEGVPPGIYELDVTLRWLCGEKHALVRVEVVPARALPYELTHGVCCDANQRPFVAASRPSRLLRLEPDGGATLVAQLPRRVTALTLSFDRTLLVVSQDAWVSAFDVESLAPRFSWPHELSEPQFWAAREWVWGMETTEYRAAVRLEPDSGARVTVAGVALNSGHGLALIDDATAVTCPTWLASVVAMPDGGARVLSSSSECCGDVFATSVPRLVLSGCGDLAQVTDGGISYAGKLDADGLIMASAPAGSDAQWFVRTDSSQNLTLRKSSLQSLLPLVSRPAGLADSTLSETLPPSFMFVDQQGVLHMFTPTASPAGLSWEETSP